MVINWWDIELNWKLSSRNVFEGINYLDCLKWDNSQCGRHHCTGLVSWLHGKGDIVSWMQMQCNWQPTLGAMTSLPGWFKALLELWATASPSFLGLLFSGGLILATRKGTQTVSEKMKELESCARGMQSILVCKKGKVLGSVSSGTWWQRWSWDSLWRQWGRTICRKRKNSCQNPEDYK